MGNTIRWTTVHMSRRMQSRHLKLFSIKPWLLKLEIKQSQEQRNHDTKITIKFLILRRAPVKDRSCLLRERVLQRNLTFMGQNLIKIRGYSIQTPNTRAVLPHENTAARFWIKSCQWEQKLTETKHKISHLFHIDSHMSTARIWWKNRSRRIRAQVEAESEDKGASRHLCRVQTRWSIRKCRPISNRTSRVSRRIKWHLWT